MIRILGLATFVLILVAAILLPLGAGAAGLIKNTGVGQAPSGVAVNLTTNKIYAANSASNSVSVIDGASSLVTATIAVGTSPSSVAVNRVTNQIYVANAVSKSLSVIDGATNLVTTTIG